MKHRFTAVLTALMMVGTVVSTTTLSDAVTMIAKAETSGTCGENLTWTLDDEGTLTISGTGDMNNYDANITAPWDSFHQHISVKNAIIENGVTSIGHNAFYECRNLESVTIPESVSSIASGSFYRCHSLISITIPERVTNIEYATFVECKSLTSIIISGSVESIAQAAFNGCTNLKSITFLNPECQIYDEARTICNRFNSEYTGKIYGYDGSTAQAYAEKYNCKFESLGAAPEQPAEVLLGDVNGDTTINASDAANVLIAAAAAGAGRELGLTEAQIRAADVNEDSTVNASDAAVILIYSAAVGAGNEDAKISDFVRK